MQIILSPAKKMRVDTDSLSVLDLPPFLERTGRLLDALRAYSPRELQALWKCNDAIAAQNIERLAHMSLTRNLTPAILSYEGIQYQYMAPGVLDRESLAYLQNHVRILSGFYGMVRPFDGVTPYRLEMGAKLSVDGARDLYAFWGDAMAQALARESDLVLNLASREYSKAVEPHLPPHVSFVTCVFGEEKEGKVIEKGTKCKMARGRMVRFLAEHQVEALDGVKAFSELGYSYAEEYSQDKIIVFIQKEC